jgi:hypothetical protein
LKIISEYSIVIRSSENFLCPVAMNGCMEDWPWEKLLDQKSRTMKANIELWLLFKIVSDLSTFSNAYSQLDVVF